MLTKPRQQLLFTLVVSLSALLTSGTQTPPFFLKVVETLHQALPQAERKVFTGAGHVPHMSHPGDYIDVVKNFCLVQANGPAGGLAV